MISINCVRTVCLIITVGLIVTVKHSFKSPKSIETGIFLLICRPIGRCNSINISVNFVWCSIIVSAFRSGPFLKYKKNSLMFTIAKIIPVKLKEVWKKPMLNTFILSITHQIPLELEAWLYQDMAFHTRQLECDISQLLNQNIESLHKVTQIVSR